MQTFPDMPDGRDWIDCSVAEHAERRNGERAWWDPRDAEWKGGEFPRSKEDIMAGRPSSLSLPAVMLRSLGGVGAELSDEELAVLGILHRDGKSIYEPAPGNRRGLSDLDENHQKMGIACDSHVIYALLREKFIECYFAREGFYLWRITSRGRFFIAWMEEGSND